MLGKINIPARLNPARIYSSCPAWVNYFEFDVLVVSQRKGSDSLQLNFSKRTGWVFPLSALAILSHRLYVGEKRLDDAEGSDRRNRCRGTTPPLYHRLRS